MMYRFRQYNKNHHNLDREQQYFHNKICYLNYSALPRNDETIKLTRITALSDILRQALLCSDSKRRSFLSIRHPEVIYPRRLAVGFFIVSLLFRSYVTCILFRWKKILFSHEYDILF